MRTKATGLGVALTFALCTAGCVNSNTAATGGAGLVAESTSQNLPVTSDDKDLMQSHTSSSPTQPSDAQREGHDVGKIDQLDPYFPPQAVIPNPPSSGVREDHNSAIAMPSMPEELEVPRPSRPVPVLPQPGSASTPVDSSEIPPSTTTSTTPVEPSEDGPKPPAGPLPDSTSQTKPPAESAESGAGPEGGILNQLPSVPAAPAEPTPEQQAPTKGDAKEKEQSRIDLGGSPSLPMLRW